MFAWTIASRYFDQLWTIFVSVIFHLPTPSSDTIFWGLIGLGTIVVGSVLIGAQIFPWFRRHRGDLHVEFDVKWNLSGDILSVPPLGPFGTEDRVGSNKASRLHISQRGKTIVLTGRMRKLKPSYTYAVYLGKPFVPFSIGETGPNPVIGAEGAPYRTFTTNGRGNGDWDRTVAVNELTRYRIVDRFTVLVNDGPKNKTVLISEDISIAL